ncbi:MAG TPA: hypothetical protein VI452_09445 [Marmoricola sp.]|jgi:hypothetical protein
MHIRPALVSAAAAAALALVPLGAASAQTYQHSDPAKDVASQSVDSTTNASTPAPTTKDPDIVRMTVRHTGQRVNTRLRLRDLARTGDLAMVGLKVRTNEHVHRELDVFSAPGQWGGRTMFSSPRKSVTCKGVRHHLDYATNVITLSIPSSCLSNPRWVQVGVGAVRLSGKTAYGDDAQSSTMANNLHWSPRIHRG